MRLKMQTSDRFMPGIAGHCQTEKGPLQKTAQALLLLNN
jgi:hypothetical protein